MDEPIQKLAQKYLPLANEILREAIRIPADYVDRSPDEGAISDADGNDQCVEQGRNRRPVHIPGNSTGGTRRRILMTSSPVISSLIPPAPADATESR